MITNSFKNSFKHSLVKYSKNIALLSGLLALCSLSTAYAGGSSTGMPYENVLDQLSKSLSGPVAKSVALIGIVGSGATLIFGGEISGFLKTVIYLVLVCSLLILGNTLIEKVGGSGFNLPEEDVAHTYVIENYQYQYNYNFKV